jgi:hypothetical protein
MRLSKAWRGVAIGACVLIGLLLSAASGAWAGSTPPLTQLTQVQSQLSAMAGSADASGKAALGEAGTHLGVATAQSLWADASDAVPPPYGDTVFTASTAATQDLAGILRDRTVSHDALISADEEIVEAERELADEVQEQAGLPPRSAIGNYQQRWDAAFQLLGGEITRAATSVPQARIEQAATNYLSSEQDELLTIPRPITGPPLRASGKPEFFYYGGEFCPLCAVDRWSLVVGLAQFGEFSPLALMESATYIEDPATKTFTFYNSHYTSPYVTFVPVEAFTTQPGTITCKGDTQPWWTALQQPTRAEQEILNQYDEAPCSIGFPFLDFGNKWSTLGPYPNPAVIGGMSWQQIASTLANPNAAVAQDLDGGAEIVTAQICEMDGEQPARVCDSRVVQLYQTDVNSRFE